MVTASDPHITSANSIGVNWSQLCLCLSHNVTLVGPVILVAWNRDSCDLKWSWKLTQAPGLQLVWPGKVLYFKPYSIANCYTNDLKIGTL